MTSITQLLSPWPVAKPHTIVLRDQPDHLSSHMQPPSSYQAISDVMAAQAPTSPPATSPTAAGGSDNSDGDNNQTDGRKGYGKRELSTSKRAAQNRAAQRAFRQRKEGYIKKLEEQVRDYQALSENFKAVQSENYQLRDYIINLQSRLLESQHEVPPPPSNVDGLQPGAHKQHQPLQHINSQPQPAVTTPTLPRIAEMGSGNSPQDTYGFEQVAKRIKTDNMTPAQAALQGNAVLGQQQGSTASR